MKVLFERPIGIMFHHFWNEVHSKGQGAISSEDLEEIILGIGRENILDAEDFYQKALNNTLKQGETCFTFDDNLRCQFDIALPVLEKYQIKAFWFIYSSMLEGTHEKLEIYRDFRTTCFKNIDDFYERFFHYVYHVLSLEKRIEGQFQKVNWSKYLEAGTYYSLNDKKFRYVRDDIFNQMEFYQVMDALIKNSDYNIEERSRLLWMEREQLEQLNKLGHVLGLHSHTHATNFKSFSVDDQISEYQKNSEWIFRITGKMPKVMSHPNNSYNEETVKLLRALGVKLGFCDNDHPENESLLEFPRDDHTYILRRIRSL